MVRITKLADYAIVLLARFARDGEGTVHTARGLAAETRVPAPTVSKILKALAHEGLLLSHRGVRGGYSLARDPAEITVAQMVTALEGPIAMTECLGEPAGACEIELLCPVKSTWERINAAVRSALESLTLAEVARPFLRPERPAHPVRTTAPAAPRSS